MRVFSIFAAVVLLAGVTACSTTSVTTDWDRTMDFSHHSTFTFDEDEQGPKSLMKRRAEDAVKRQLEAKGLRQVSDGADLLVAISGFRHVERQVDVQRSGRVYRGRGWGATYVDVNDIPKGTLVVDLVDTQTGDLAWRGEASDTVSTKSEKNQETMESAIVKMFEDFPPPGS